MRNKLKNSISKLDEKMKNFHRRKMKLKSALSELKASLDGVNNRLKQSKK